MKMYEPIAYTYEADYHCPNCAEARFGEGVPDSAEDSEGNPIGAVSPFDEWWEPDYLCESLYCGDCHAILDTAHSDQCEENFGMEPCTLSESERV